MVLDIALSQDGLKQGYGLMCMAKLISGDWKITWGAEDAKPRVQPVAGVPARAYSVTLTQAPAAGSLRGASMQSCHSGFQILRITPSLLSGAWILSTHVTCQSGSISRR